MYENGIDVRYLLMNDDESDELRGNWLLPERTLHLPGWAAGDPQMALALYLFGHRSYVDLVKVVDWTPSEAPSDDPYCAAHGERFDPESGCGGCLSLQAVL